MDKLTNVKHNLLLGATEWAMTEAGAHNFINCTQVNPVKMRYRTQIWNNASTNKHRWRVTEWSAVTALQGRSVPLKISEHRLIKTIRRRTRPINRINGALATRRGLHERRHRCPLNNPAPSDTSLSNNQYATASPTGWDYCVFTSTKISSSWTPDVAYPSCSQVHVHNQNILPSQSFIYDSTSVIKVPKFYSSNVA